MADGELAIAEGSCGLYKKFNLTSAINTTNMVSYPPRGGGGG